MRKSKELNLIYVIGKGRIGTALSLAEPSLKLIGRDYDLGDLRELASEDLIFVCTRNDSLQSILDAIPSFSHKNVVLVQNGMLSPFIDGLENPIAGRAILYFAVSKKGEMPKPGGNTLVCGTKAEAIAEFFKSVNIPVEIVSKEELAKVEMEKLLWNSVMGLMGEVYSEKVDQSLERWGEVEEVISELLPVIKEDAGIAFDQERLLNSLKNYSKEVSHFEARIKEWEWRNQWFFDAIKRTGRSAEKWFALHKKTSFADRLI